MDHSIIQHDRRQNAPGTGDLFLDLISNAFVVTFQINAFLASLATSLGVTLLLAIAFSLARPRHSLVYAPKIKHADARHAPPPIERGILAWLKPVIKTEEADLVNKLGLDAIIFLRFTRMLRNLFLVLTVIGLVITIPVNVTQSLDAIKHVPGGNFFIALTPQFIFGQAWWSHVVVSWAFDIIVAAFLWVNYRKIRQLRRDYFESSEYQQSLHARTLMITDLPSKLRTDEGILRVTDEVNPSGLLPRASIGRNVKILPKLIEEHEETVRRLESVLSKYLKNPDRLPATRPTMKPPRKFKGDRPAGRVDSIEYLTNRIKVLEQEIRDVRDRIDKRDAMPYGFASWEQIETAHTVAFAARGKHPDGTTIVLAPRPNDLIWENLALSKAARRTKRLMNMGWVTILTLLWTPINACIAIFLSNLSNLGRVWPAFQTSLNGHPTGWAIVQGIASPAITSLVYLILPIIFRRLSIKAGDTTKTSRERHVIHDLYAFFCFNNLIVFSLFSAIWAFVTAVITSKRQGAAFWDAVIQGGFYNRILISLCTVSPFWVTWLLQRNLGAAIDIAQIFNLFVVWFARTFMSPTPRQNIEWTAPPPFDYASYYNYFLFYALVALCFATLQPIVLPVTAFYFVLDAWLKKYLLMYVFVTKTESGGQMWRVLYNRMIFSTILANVIVALVVKARGTWTMIGVMAPLPFLMLGFKYYCHKAFDHDLHYYVRGSIKDSEAHTGSKPRKVGERALAKFGHPALYKPLMTPMVHSKAKSVLGQVYRGRLHSDGLKSPGYSDIALEPLSAQGEATSPMPSALKNIAPFEIVPEGQQDFSYFKNRADFRQEFSGGIYGRPEDLISERSQTPRSFMGHGTWSPEASSRASSPSPSHSRAGSIQLEGVGDDGVVRSIPRKPVDTANLPAALQVHGHKRSGSGGGGSGDYTKSAHGHVRTASGLSAHKDAGDLPLRPDAETGGVYPTTTNESQARLLSDSRGTSPGPGFAMDRWRTQDSARGTTEYTAIPAQSRDSRELRDDEKGEGRGEYDRFGGEK